MGFLAFICIFLGVYPKPLYDILPYEMEYYHAYSISHVATQLQLLMFSALVFFLFLALLKRTDTIALDTDWFYRKGGRLFYQVMDKGLNAVNRVVERIFVGEFLVGLARFVRELPAKLLAKICWPFWQTAFDAPDKKTISENLLKRAQAGFYPISIMGLFVAIYFGLLFLL
jgi:multicomponent Na+:H+ antiporter subunit D